MDDKGFNKPSGINSSQDNRIIKSYNMSEASSVRTYNYNYLCQDVRVDRFNYKRRKI